MPRHREKPNHPFMQTLMDMRGATTFAQYSELTGTPEDRIRNYANSDGNNRLYETLLSDAESFGLTVDEFLLGMLQRFEKQKAG